MSEHDGQENKEAWVQGMADCEAENASLRADNERLRAALEGVEGMLDAGKDYTNEAIRIARAALSEQTGKDAK